MTCYQNWGQCSGIASSHGAILRGLRLDMTLTELEGKPI